MLKEAVYLKHIDQTKISTGPPVNRITFILLTDWKLEPKTSKFSQLLVLKLDAYDANELETDQCQTFLTTSIGSSFNKEN